MVRSQVSSSWWLGPRTGRLITAAWLLGGFGGVALWGCVDQPIVAAERRASGGTGHNPDSGFGNAATRGGVGPQSDGVAGGSIAASFGQCVPFGSNCAGNANGCCLGLNCNAGVCTCAGANESCTKSSECCSGVCFQGGKCAPPCQQADSSCSTTGMSKCCSGSCLSSPGKMQRSCASVDGCQPLGEYCSHDAECCTNYCSPKSACAERSQSLSFCLGSGETHCTDYGQVCCQGFSCVAQVTQDPQSVRRCTPDQCVVLGGECSHDDACCQSAGAVCTWNGVMNKRLCTTCAASGQPCGPGGIECCSGNYCMNQVCVSAATGAGGAGFGTTVVCANNGESCRDEPCCTGGLLICDSVTQLCGTKP